MQPARLDRAEPVTILAAVLLPPLGVFRAFGPGKDFAIACAMTVAGFLPGMGFALIRVLGPKDRRITSIPTGRDEPRQSPQPKAFCRVHESGVFPLPDPMRAALTVARDAAAAGEVPVGAVIVRDGQIIATAANAPRSLNDPTGHAEILAIRAAAAVLGRDRLDGCDLWVTLEPCAMCAGAISHARIDRLYYAADDAKGGAVAHGPRFFTQPTCHHRPEIYPGIGEGEAAALLRAFFAERR